MLSIFVVLCLLVTSSLGDVNGERPASGTCLCLTGTNVNARESGNFKSVFIFEKFTFPLSTAKKLFAEICDVNIMHWPPG